MIEKTTVLPHNFACLTYILTRLAIQATKRQGPGRDTRLLRHKSKLPKRPKQPQQLPLKHHRPPKQSNPQRLVCRRSLSLVRSPGSMNDTTVAKSGRCREPRQRRSGGRLICGLHIDPLSTTSPFDDRTTGLPTSSLRLYQQHFSSSSDLEPSPVTRALSQWLHQDPHITKTMPSPSSRPHRQCTSSET